MFNIGRPQLPAYALQVLRPTWIDNKASTDKFPNDAVWSGHGIYEVPIHARRDGYIVFDFPKSAQYRGGDVPSHFPQPGVRLPQNILDTQEQRQALRYRRLKYMNAFLACLYSSYATVQKIGTAVQPPVFPTTYFNADLDSNERWQIYHNGEHPETPSPSSPIVQIETIQNSVELMANCDRVLSNTGLDLLSLIYMACHQYGNHQFESAHLIAWSTCEMLINRLWANLLKELDIRNGGHTAINAGRREQLEGRDFTASIVSQSLSLHGKIDDDMLGRLDKARKKRNAFAHSLDPVASDDVAKAIRTATDLMTHVVGSRITSQLSFSALD